MPVSDLEFTDELKPEYDAVNLIKKLLHKSRNKLSELSDENEKLKKEINLTKQALEGNDFVLRVILIYVNIVVLFPETQHAQNLLRTEVDTVKLHKSELILENGQKVRPVTSDQSISVDLDEIECIQNVPHSVVSSVSVFTTSLIYFVGCIT